MGAERKKMVRGEGKMKKAVKKSGLHKEELTTKHTITRMV